MTYLVLVCGAHTLDDLLRLGLGHAALLRNDLHQDGVDFAGHVRGVAADVEVRLLEEQLVDLLCLLLQAVLDVDLVGPFPGERGDQGELVS